MRHAQTYPNIGQETEMCDARLTQHGKEMASTAKIPGVEIFDLVILSPMRRALQTWSEVRHIHAKEVILDSRVREEISNTPDKLHPGEVKESFDDVQSRAKEFIQHVRELVKSKNASSVLVVTHHNFIWHYTSTVLGIDPVSLPNCGYISHCV